MPRISIVAAVAENLTIGFKKRLPWVLPADMKHFKELTSGHTLLMGKRTFESLPNGPLPNRKNIVLTSVMSEGINEGYFEANSLDDAQELCSNAEEVFVIGGSWIYEQCLDLADRMYITWVHGEFPGDTFFPEVDYTQWVEISREYHEADEKNQHAYSFVVYDKKQ